MPQLTFERLMSIACSSALEEMANGIAHELNQPLGTIATYAQAGERMLGRPEPMIAPAADVFKHITTAALSAGDDIRRLRKLFSRELPERQQCHLPELLHELQPLLEALASRYRGTLQVAVTTELPAINIDRLRIQYVLYALVQNAFESGADVNAMSVHIKTHADRYNVGIDVEDSGKGIPPELRQHIFRPFTTTKPQGTGLALAASRAIIEAHGGTIGFESEPGAGSRFWFRLPPMVET